MNNPRKIFSQIYDKYIDKIYRFIFLKVSSQEIAEDLTSETFLRGCEAFKNRGLQPGHRPPTRPKGEQAPIENIQAFLYQIARNLLTDHYREKGKTQVVSAEYLQVNDPGQDLEEKSLLESDLNMVKLALMNLREDYQNVIIWHYLDDLPVPEVAKMLNKSEGATRVTLHRALKSLKNELEQVA